MEKTGKLYSMRHCKIRFRTLLHTSVHFLQIWPNYCGHSMLTRSPCSFSSFLWQSNRVCFSYDISSMQTRIMLTKTFTSPRRRIRFALDLCIKPKQTSTREGREKHNTGTTTYNHMDSQERVVTYVRTIWPGGRQYAGDAATQLAAVYSKKNLNASRSSEHPSVRRGNVKTLIRWGIISCKNN